MEGGEVDERIGGDEKVGEDAEYKNVPSDGIAVAGSFKLPDMLAPAVIPVTAGKKTAKTEKNPSPL